VVSIPFLSRMGVLESKGSDGILHTMADRTLSAYTAPKVQIKLSSIYYTPKCYWRGLAAIKKLATAAKVSKQVARDWLKRQAIWQIYLPARDTSRGRSLTKTRLMQSIRLIFCIFHTIASTAAFTSLR